MTNKIVIDNRYEIISSIGKGGFSKVFCVRDNVTNKILAAKILDYKFETTDDRKYKQFRQEARTIAALNSRNIIKIHDFGIYDDHPYLIMDYIKGKDLKEIINENGYLLIDEFYLYMKKILSAVEICHANKVIHRDIKADNVKVTSDGSVILLDFGVSFISEEKYNLYEMDTKYVSCTITHAAPDLIKNPKGSVQTDIYALGVTMFEMLTGRCPFDSNNTDREKRKKEIYLMHKNCPFPDVRKYNPNVTDEIAKIINKCCEKQPKNRYKSVKDLHLDLANAYNDYLNNKNNTNTNTKKGLFSFFRRKK